MVVYSIFMFKLLPDQDPKTHKPTIRPVMLATKTDLSSFNIFQRSTVKEVLTFGNRQVASLSRPGQRSVVKIEATDSKPNCHYGTCGPNQEFACIVTTDMNYPTRVAFSLVSKAGDAFLKAAGSKVADVTTDVNIDIPEWTTMLQKYQDPTTADPIAQIEKDVGETRQVLVETLDDLLKRGESLQNLVDKSEDLSYQSKAFLKSSKKANSCCVIL